MPVIKSLWDSNLAKFSQFLHEYVNNALSVPTLKNYPDKSKFIDPTF